MQYLILKVLLKYVKKKDPSQTDVVDRLVRQSLDQVQPWNIEEISYETTNFTGKDRETFLRLINIPVTRGWLIRRIAGGMPELAKRFGTELHVFSRFIVYLHDGFRSGRLLLDITWNELCSSTYVSEYVPQ